MFGLGSKTQTAFVWAVAVLMLVSAGIAYRIPAHRLKLFGDEPVMLSVPLKNFPKQFGNWVGSDINIPTTTKEYMERNFADDYFSRRYVNSSEKIWADVYVVYCASRPGGILGHRPSVCYPAHGWQEVSSETSQFSSQNGRQIDCLVQKFRKPSPSLDEVVVLSFYIRNGRITAKESDFSGLFGRKANLSKDPSQYVAQVQISSVLESSVRKAAGEITDIILDFLPDESGKVSAAGFIRSSGGKVKSTE
jgi:EpsI family protein